ncbi:ATP-binding protein [Verrucomicrobia bacterium]|jgi:two-component system, OmpR family, phosphate regulon sensor histidine kinase PhoR|nr:PAS domain-containing protein [Verrucomicrobiota bacterium]MDA7667467.1 ATP-binding protein [bacterium]MDB4798192.1 ATP-binding protein [Verrucomicrobiota bacterium]
MWKALSLGLVILLVLEFFFERRRRRKLTHQLAESRSAHSETEIRLSRELQEAATQQETLFDRMIEGVLILDGQGKVRLVNAALRDLFGLTGELQGKRLIETVRSHELQEIVLHAKEVGHVTGQELMISSGVENKHFAVNASSFKESSSRTGVIVILHDLTGMKNLESGRREFVANVSHELRTPLSMIKGYVETLLEGNVSDPKVESRFLGKIQKHSDRLTFLIEDLLALSQLESNQIALSFSRLPLAELIDRVFEDLRDKAASRGVTLNSNIAPDLEVSVDSDRIQQVFQNLIENGIKYGRPEGELFVTAKLGEDGFVVVSVADDGPGIPAEVGDRVFERFFRVDKARSRDQGGTGLGLAIVKHIVQSHGGRVWLDQGEQTGAVFSFSIPIDSGSEKRFES